MSVVLVTGGAGFLGAATVRRLAKRGDEVVAFDNNQSGTPRLLDGLGSNVHRVWADVTDLGGLLHVLQSYRVRKVVHAAAVVSVASSLEVPALTLRTNVLGTVNVFEAQRLFGLERVVHISSEENFGAFLKEPAGEDHPVAPLNPYAISKAAAEQMGRYYRDVCGFDAVSVRTSTGYGPHFPRLRFPRTFIEAALAKRALHMPHGGDTRIDQTYIDDFVDGLLLVLDQPALAHGVYNVSSGESCSLATMVEIIRELIPEADLSIGGGNFWYTDRLQMPKKGALDLTRIRTELGFRPRFDLRTGLAAYIDWYRRGCPLDA